MYMHAHSHARVPRWVCIRVCVRVKNTDDKKKRTHTRSRTGGAIWRRHKAVVIIVVVDRSRRRYLCVWGFTATVNILRGYLNLNTALQRGRTCVQLLYIWYLYRNVNNTPPAVDETNKNPKTVRDTDLIRILFLTDFITRRHRVFFLSSFSIPGSSRDKVAIIFIDEKASTKN